VAVRCAPHPSRSRAKTISSSQRADSIACQSCRSACGGEAALGLNRRRVGEPPARVRPAAHR
jgi:hypothetical protein